MKKLDNLFYVLIYEEVFISMKCERKYVIFRNIIIVGIRDVKKCYDG